MDKGRGQFEARRSPAAGDWEVLDLLAQTSRRHGLSQEAAQRAAEELNEDHRILDELLEVRVKVAGRWQFGDAKAAERRDGTWYWYVKPDRRRWDWFPETHVHEPDGVFPVRRR